MVVYMARRVAGAEGEELAGEVNAWIEQNLGRDYPGRAIIASWNSACRNVLIRRDYRPSRTAAENPIEQFMADLEAGRLTADRALSGYATIVYKQTGSYEETARLLEIDRRTVKSRIDREFLARCPAVH